MSLRTLLALAAAAIATAVFGVLGIAVIATEPLAGPAPLIVERFHLPDGPLLLRAISIVAGLLFGLVAVGWFGVIRLILLGRLAARRGALLMAVGSALLLLPSLIAGRASTALLLLPLLATLAPRLSVPGRARGWPMVAVLLGGMATIALSLTVAG